MKNKSINFIIQSQESNKSFYVLLKNNKLTDDEINRIMNGEIVEKENKIIHI